MDGEKKLSVLVFGLAILCNTILYGFLFVSLWRYKELVGLTLLIVLVAIAGVHIRGQLIEQRLRQARYHHAKETPLDPRQQGYQANSPSRVPSRFSRQPAPSYEDQPVLLQDHPDEYPDWSDEHENYQHPAHQYFPQPARLGDWSDGYQQQR